MEKVEFTPVELMQALNWKKSKVYYWIGQGKFETVQRLDGQKIVISAEDLQRLKKSDNSESFENSEIKSEIPINSENVQEIKEQNVTKNYKNVSNNFNSEAFELFNKSLETIERIHQTALNNFGYTTKLLTDSKSEVVEENLELKAEVKTVQLRLEKSQKIHFWKNLIIIGLIIVLICLTGYVLISSKNSNLATKQNLSVDTQKNPVQAVTPTPELSSKGVKK